MCDLTDKSVWLTIKVRHSFLTENYCKNNW